MKSIVLKRIKLQDWKSKNLDVSFNDGTTRISAKNEVGKSSLQQAWMWLFTSYTTSTSTKNANLFDSRYALSHDTPVAKVTAWIVVDGVEYVVERTAKAKFKRPRGSEVWVKDSSDEYTISVDGIDMSSTTFVDWVENTICPMQYIAYAMDGSFFTSLAVTDRAKARAILESLCSVDSQSLYDKFPRIAEGLAKYNPLQIKTQIVGKMRPIKSRIDAIPTVIESKNRVIDAIGSSFNTESLNDKINEISASMITQPTPELIQELIECSKRLGLSIVVDAERVAIKALSEEKKELAKELVRLEGDAAEVESLIEGISELVADGVNSKLDGCQIAMFNVQKNGDKTLDCILTNNDGVHFGALSNSARQRINLSIQNMFREFCGVDMITWVDEAAVYDNEHLPRPTGQVCYLFAGESDTLVVE